MRKDLFELIKNSHTNERDLAILEKIFTLYEQLQFSSTIDELANDIFDWMKREFQVDNMTFSLFNTEKKNREDIFVKGEDFYLDDDHSLFFIINTQTSQNAIVSFYATSKTHYNILKENYNAIESAFFLISPIVQSRILKRNYIFSQSIDSVTNVYNRKYLTEHIQKQLRLTDSHTEKIFFLMVGIDRFKAIIDEFDYEVADKVLVNLANTIYNHIGEGDKVARLTGDEFLVSIQSTQYEDEVTEIAQKIIVEFSQSKVWVNKGTQTFQKTICIGYDILHVDGNDTMDTIIKNADIALTEAKNRSRSSLLSYQEITDYESVELF